MDRYPATLTSLVSPLVALLGHQESHAQIADLLSTGSVRIQTISISSPEQLTKLRENGRTQTGGGVIDAGWLPRQQTQRPGVVLLLVDGNEVAGEPASWASLVSKLDATKAAAKVTSTRPIVLVQRLAGESLVPDDRIAMVCRHVGIDRYCIIQADTSDAGAVGLQRLLPLIHDQATAYYAAETQRRLALHSQANDPTVEANLRTAFELGVVAEFRSDYEAAYAMYTEAYNYAQQLSLTGSEQYKRYLELRGVAEYIHVKLLTLLIFGLSQPSEAAAQLSCHIQLFNTIPFSSPPLPLVANHWHWKALQYRTAADLLISSSGTTLTDLPITRHPSRLLLAAGEALVQRRKVSEKIIESMSIDDIDTESAPEFGQLADGQFVGQYIIAAAAVGGGDSSRDGAGATITQPQPLNEADLLQHLEGSEVACDQSKEAITVLEMAVTAMRQSSGFSVGSICHAELVLGEEYVAAGDGEGARTVLQHAATTARHSGWRGPLYKALLLLKQCSEDHNTTNSAATTSATHIASSLEAAAVCPLPTKSAQRQVMAMSAIKLLSSSGQQFDFDGASEECIWLQSVFDTCAGWMQPIAVDSTTTSDSRSSSSQEGGFGVGVRSKLPVVLPIQHIELTLTGTTGTTTVQLQPCTNTRQPLPVSPSTSKNQQPLQPETWHTFVAPVPTQSSGKLTATAIKIYLKSPTTTCTFTLLFSPSTATSSSSSTTTTTTTPVFHRSTGFQLGVYDFHLPPRHAPPVVTLSAYKTGLLGEPLPVTCCVAASGTAAVHKMRLRVTAVHRDTNKPLAINSTTSGGGSSSSASPEQQDITATVLVVEDTAAGCSNSVEFSITPTMHGEVDIQATLEYSLVVSSSSSIHNSNEEETGTLETSLAVPIQLPFELDFKVLVPATSTFVFVPETEATAAAATQTAAARSALDMLSIADDDAVLEQQQQTDGSDVGGDKGSVVINAADLALMTAAWPTQVDIPVGMDCIAVVSLVSVATSVVDILEVQWKPPPSNTNTFTVTKISSSPSPPCGITTTTAVAAGICDRHQAVFRIRALQPTSVPSSLGHLAIKWQRHKSATAGVAVTSLSLSRLGSIQQPRSPKAIELTVPDTSNNLSSANTLEFNLPRSVFKPTQLITRLSVPSSGTIGQPMQLSVEFKNNSSGVCHELQLSVNQPNGFMIAGDRLASVSLLPGSSQQLKWELVPYHAGVLQLPDISISGVGGDGAAAAVSLTKNTTVVVKHA